MSSFFESELAEHATVAAAVRDSLAAPFDALVDAAVAALEGGGKLLLFGNGGSAADCQHLATELTVRYVTDRRALAAIALTTDTSALTAIGNDFGFERLFERQIEALGRPGDLALGISTSGRSENVVRGLVAAAAAGLRTAVLTGGDGGRVKEVAQVVLTIPSRTTARIQEMHIMLGQMLCGAIEHRLGLVGGAR